MRRAQFSRPEPGFSLYEGRTRGKRLRYTFEDEDDFEDSDVSFRRSGRHSDRSTPAERGPVVTASGRQVRTREGGMYGESLLSGQGTAADTPVTNDFDDSELSGRGSRQATRNAQGESRKRRFNEIYNDSDQISDEDDAQSSAGWNSADNEDEGEDDKFDDKFDDEEDEADVSDLDSSEEEPSSLIVKLKLRKPDGSMDDSSLLDVIDVKPDAVPAPLPNGAMYSNGAGNGYVDTKMEDAVEGSKEIPVGQAGTQRQEAVKENKVTDDRVEEREEGLRGDASEESQSILKDYTVEETKEAVKDDSGIADGEVKVFQESIPQAIPQPVMQVHHPLIPVDRL